MINKIFYMLVTLVWLPSTMACFGTSSTEQTQQVQAHAEAPATEHKMPERFVIISSGHTGCLPTDITSYKPLLKSRHILNGESFYLWQLKCNQKKFVCSIYSIQTDGKSLDTSCSEVLETTHPSEPEVLEQEPIEEPAAERSVSLG